MLVVGRVIAGIAIGLASAVVPLYQAEVTAPAIRGRVISLWQWFVFTQSCAPCGKTVRLLILMSICVYRSQVNYMGHSMSVFRRIWVFLYRWRGVISYPLGIADDTCYRSFTWDAVFSRSTLQNII